MCGAADGRTGYLPPLSDQTKIFTGNFLGVHPSPPAPCPPPHLHPSHLLCYVGTWLGARKAGELNGLKSDLNKKWDNDRRRRAPPATKTNPNGASRGCRISLCPPLGHHKRLFLGGFGNGQSVAACGVNGSKKSRGQAGFWAHLKGNLASIKPHSEWGEGSHRSLPPFPMNCRLA